MTLISGCVRTPTQRDDLRAAAGELKTPQPEREAKKSDNTASIDRDRIVGPQTAARFPPLVRAIEIDVTLGHWESGVDNDRNRRDGVSHRCRRPPVAVDGTLDVDLLAQQLMTVADQSGFPAIGRWTVAGHFSDFYRVPSIVFPFRPCIPISNRNLIRTASRTHDSVYRARVRLRRAKR
jgi:hypothetical protein